MNKASLITYQRDLWPAACAAQGWDVHNKNLRREVRRRCMVEIGSPWDGEELGPLPNAEVTALFVFMRHLAAPNNINALQAWTDCKADYKAYNASRQADHWQRKAFGRKGGGKMIRDRFKGRERATPRPYADEPLTLKEATDRRLTMKRAAQRQPQPNAFASVAAALGQEPEDDTIPF